jgi:hypothetical protein
MNFVYLTSSSLHVFKFELWFMHWKQGREKGGEKLHCIHRTYPKSQGGACAFLLHFCLLGGVVCCTKAVWPVLATGLTGLCPELALVQGEYAYVHGELVYALVVCALCLSIVCLGWVESLPLPKGSETCLLQVILLFAFSRLSIACWSFFLFVSFLFLFSDYQTCVLSMHSSRGRLRTMCGSRTGG